MSAPVSTPATPESTASYQWNATDIAVDNRFFVANRNLRVTGISYAVDVAGNDAGAVTGVIRKVASGAAVSAGTALHSSSINLKSTANTVGALTLSTTATDLELSATDALGFDLTGTPAVGVGVVTVYFVPR